MATSIAVWYLILNTQNFQAQPAQFGPYSDLESCNAVADMRAADGGQLLNIGRGCIQVNIPVQTLQAK